MKNEVRPIVIKDEENGKEYTLEFNRESIAFSETKGFDINDIEKKPMTRIPELFYYAFRMHHRNVSREKTDAILDTIGWNEKLLTRLGELYAAPFNTLLAGDDEPKNPKMTVEF